MALTEAQVVIFRIFIVRFNSDVGNFGLLGDNYEVNTHQKKRGCICFVIGVRNSEKLCDPP